MVIIHYWNCISFYLPWHFCQFHCAIGGIIREKGCFSLYPVSPYFHNFINPYHIFSLQFPPLLICTTLLLQQVLPTIAPHNSREKRQGILLCHSWPTVLMHFCCGTGPGIIQGHIYTFLKSMEGIFWERVAQGPAISLNSINKQYAS